VNLLGPGPRLMKKEFTGPRSHKRWENTGVGYDDSRLDSRRGHGCLSVVSVVR